MTATEIDALLAASEANMDRMVAEGRAALVRSQARIRRERAAQRAALSAYYAGGAATAGQERIARGEFVTVSISQDGARTVTRGPGL